jgi:CxxC-x17-CxxC domain-containing protein
LSTQWPLQAESYYLIGGKPKSVLINGNLYLPAGLMLFEANGPRELIMAQTEAAQALEINHESEFQDRPIRCVDCNENFIWTAGEQVFFHDKGLKNEPKRCKPCKQAKNERLAAIAAAQSSGVRQRIEVSVQCAQCGQQTTVPFYPSQGRPVYCRSCFLAGRNSNGEAAQM